MENKKAFGLIEVISTTSILLIIAIIWFSFQGAKIQKTKNVWVISDLEKINNNIISFKSDNSILPAIIWNKNYFNKVGDYSENKNSSFGLHWFIDNNYAYWKTTNNKFYQISGVLNIDWKYSSKVIWNYVWNKNLIWLIREYNWPSFVFDGSKTIFPYNPTENRLVAKVNNFSWKIIIKTKNGREIKNESDVESYNLIEWDSIKTGFSSKATIFFSDWSISVLEENSKLILENMDLNKKDNLITRIKLYLESGILWTKATSLNSEGSSFEVYTEDNVASIRWTVFWMKYRKDKTSLTVREGEVKLKSSKTNKEKIIKSWEYEWDKIQFNEFEIIRPYIIHDPVSGYTIINDTKK